MTKASGYISNDRRRVVIDQHDDVVVKPESEPVASARSGHRLPESEPEQFPTWMCPTHGQERDYNEPGIPADKKRCIQMIAAGVDTFAVDGRWTWGQVMARAVAMDEVPDLSTYGGLELRQQNNMGLLGKLIGYGKQPPFRRHDGSPPDPPMSRHDGSPPDAPAGRH